MVDHRRIQRTLFLMQMDGGFASRIFEHDPQICSTTGLTDEEFSWLRAQDPAALSADPGGKRRAQIVGNIASEFRLSLSAASQSSKNAGEPGPAWLDHFLGSAEFHGAVLGGDRLPLAFARFALHDARSKGRAELVPVIELEFALARLRREAAGGRLGALGSHHPSYPHGNDQGAEPSVSGLERNSAADTLWLSHRARVVDLPSGTHAWCEILQTNLENDLPAPRPSGFPTELREVVLLFAYATGARHRPALVRTERLEPPVDELLKRSRTGLTIKARSEFARAQGAEPEDLERFLIGFLDEGVLVR